RHLGSAPFHPGDPLFPRFEIYTPGEALPESLDVRIELVDSQGEAVSSSESGLSLPRGAIGYVVDNVEVRLPNDLAAGTYRIDVIVLADGEAVASGSVHFEVNGEPQLLRQLLARGISMQDLVN